MAPLLKGKTGDVGRSGSDNRLFINAVVWMARSGAPWRNTAIEAGVLEYLEKGSMFTTPYEIDLGRLLDNEPIKLARYHDQIEFLECSNSLKI